MYAILVSAFSFVLNWFVRAIVVKFIAFTAIGLLLGYIVAFMLQHVNFEEIAGIGPLISALPPGFLYFFGLFRLEVGIPMMIAAMVIRFGIRRLPIIG